MRLKDKKVFIIGGSSGIGATLVRCCLSEGARVFFTYNKNENGAKEVAEGYDGKVRYSRLSLEIGRAHV